MGYGILTKEDGEKYSGYFSNGIRSGYGTIKYADGSTFEGVFFNDKPTGDIYRPSQVKPAPSMAEMTYFNADSWPTSENSSVGNEMDGLKTVHMQQTQEDPITSRKTTGLRKAFKLIRIKSMSTFSIIKRSKSQRCSFSLDSDSQHSIEKQRSMGRWKRTRSAFKISPSRSSLNIDKKLTSSTCYSSEAPNAPHPKLIEVQI